MSESIGVSVEPEQLSIAGHECPAFLRRVVQTVHPRKSHTAGIPIATLETTGTVDVDVDSGTYGSSDKSSLVGERINADDWQRVRLSLAHQVTTG
jgi:hypothetical protein